MVKYIKPPRSATPPWNSKQEIAELEALGTPEAILRAAKLRRLDEVLFRMGGFGRWIARKDSEAGS